MSQTPSEQSAWIVVEDFGKIDADRLEQVRQRLKGVARAMLQPNYEGQRPIARAGIAETSKLRNPYSRTLVMNHPEPLTDIAELNFQSGGDSRNLSSEGLFE